MKVTVDLTVVAVLVVPSLIAVAIWGWHWDWLGVLLGAVLVGYCAWFLVGLTLIDAAKWIRTRYREASR